MLGDAFGVPGLTVDTHFGRLVRRLGWTAEEDPVKVEAAVGGLIEKSEWTLLSHRLIFHGRRVCHSRRPACGACAIAQLCPSAGIGENDPAAAAAAAMYFNYRKLSIFGGSNEIQRNIISKMILGL